MTITFEQGASGDHYRLRVNTPSGFTMLSVDGSRAVCVAALVAFIERLPGHNVPFYR